MSNDAATAALAMEDRRFRAMATSDIAELEAVLADDLHYVHANGIIEDRQEFIRKITSGERNYQSVTLVERQVSPQTGFTIIFGKIDVEVMRSAGLLVNRLDYTAVYRDSDPRLFAWSAVKALA